MKLPHLVMAIIDKHQRRITLAQLSAMPEKQLIDCGFSPALLEQGVSAWPWRMSEESIVKPVFQYNAPNTVFDVNDAKKTTSQHNEDPDQQKAA